MNVCLCTGLFIGQQVKLTGVFYLKGCVLNGVFCFFYFVWFHCYSPLEYILFYCF